MSKTRKCRFTDNELAIHEMAVKLRKKTDDQLVEAFQQTYDQGLQNGKKMNKLPEGCNFCNDGAKKKFLALVQVTPGIGKAIYDKIEKLVLQEKDGGFIS